MRRLSATVLLIVTVSTAACRSSSTTTTPDTPATTASTTAATAPAPPPAPWRAPPLAADDVDAAARREWARAENRDSCPLLYPASLPDGHGSGLRPRPASFAGGWAYTWDVPGTPGQLPTGESSPTAGRSTFGVAGTGVASEPPSTHQWPHTLRWADGSSAGYGHEGATPVDPNPLDTTKWLAYLSVDGSRCLYNVWSNLGREHLEALLGELRFVSGSGR